MYWLSPFWWSRESLRFWGTCSISNDKWPTWKCNVHELLNIRERNCTQRWHSAFSGKRRTSRDVLKCTKPTNEKIKSSNPPKQGRQPKENVVSIFTHIIRTLYCHVFCVNVTIRHVLTTCLWSLLHDRNTRLQTETWNLFQKPSPEELCQYAS